ncbi:GntR family transcriptional regulator [Zobellella denitrificans]|uniref:GntR family transcriptional regulator n=1 Tax=Zobellella iuensis TaxID=2803811 RepID=A0ABS1QLS4_9GAMM|nr:MULTISPECIES: GntR family transcriptional regulator [Zobellella]MBL1375819.1 GntR family transcriptional regulator [Zobellella iuensis]OXS13872.1 GntR family transcriptional regulator [Zobellella denitrificans]
MATAINTLGRNSLRRRSLHEEVADCVRTMIIEGELKEGERINEPALCKQLDISRTPLREALKVLNSEGMVTIEPNRGARVSTITPEEIREHFEVICSLERRAAELAAQRATEAELTRLGQLQDKLEQYHQEQDKHQYFEINQHIHRLIIELAGNETLTQLHHQLMNRVSRGRYLAIGFHHRWEESVTEHRALLEALQARDGERAGRILAEHVMHTGDLLVRELEDKQQRLG